MISLCFHFFFFFLLASVELSSEQNRGEQRFVRVTFTFAPESFEEKNFKSCPDKQFPTTRNYQDALSPTITGRYPVYMFHGDFRWKYSRPICKIIARSRETIALGTFIQVAANSNNYNRSGIIGNTMKYNRGPRSMNETHWRFIEHAGDKRYTATWFRIPIRKRENFLPFWDNSFLSSL